MLLVLGCVLVLAGCPAPPGRERISETDQHRLQVMLNLPIIRDAQRVSGRRPGTLLNETLGWDRGYVSAGLFSADPARGDVPVTPEQIELHLADALERLRGTGWTIMSASCKAPERDRITASALPSPEPGQLGADPGLDEWDWSATVYTHVDGVSYWAELSGGVFRNGRGSVGILLRAPNVDDPPDLFPDRPPGLPVGSTCIERPGVPPVNIEQGIEFTVAERGSSQMPTVDPLYR
ncbi:MAG: hypothetical protein ABR608_07120 [Pseudonocardiaceae bacterium]